MSGPESFRGEVTLAVGPDQVATVEIHRPPANYFDAALIGALADAYDALGRRDCRAAVLCSEGRHFCAGADFGRGSGAGRLDRGPALADLYTQALRLFSAPVPVVAAVQGAAVGGGLGLACSADFRVVAPDSRLSANFVRLGFHPGFGLTATLPRVVGPQVALELLSTGRTVAGPEALALALADRLVDPPGDVRTGAHALAAELAGVGPLALAATRDTLRAGLADQVAAATAVERAAQERLLGTADFAEGTAAAAARRPPRFSGR